MSCCVCVCICGTFVTRTYLQLRLRGSGTAVHRTLTHAASIYVQVGLRMCERAKAPLCHHEKDGTSCIEKSSFVCCGCFIESLPWTALFIPSGGIPGCKTGPVTLSSGEAAEARPDLLPLKAETAPVMIGHYCTHRCNKDECKHTQAAS